MSLEALDAGVPGARAELFVLSGHDVGRSYEIVHGSSVGRALDRAVVLRDRSISRHHAHFECAEGIWSIVDDGSTNGFIVDGSRRERSQLTDLREFVIGEVLVRLRIQSAGAPSSPACSAPPLPVQVAAPTNRHDDEIEIEDEILLDSDPEATNPVMARAPSRPEPPLAIAPTSRAVADPELAARGRRVLQYHKQDARQGLFITDLAQRPLWLRALVYLLVLAITSALAWGVYRGVISLREGVSGQSATEPQDI